MADETFKLTTPNMHDDAIKNFQALLNECLHAWQIAPVVTVDGVYGPGTDTAAREICHGLGLDPASYATGMTPAVRIKMRHPETRTHAELQVADTRKAWRAALRQRLASAAAGPRAAIAFAKQHVGISESPPDSNRGPLIDEWNRAVHTPPGPSAFWCGAFANACLHAGGFPDEPFLAFCPNTEGHARGGIGGWSWHPALGDGMPGDLVLYTEPSSRGAAAHVELLVTANPFDVVGGNTSADPSTGSQSNGGCVAEHHRDPNSPALKFKGYARPPWGG
jgi:hypothetical protein